MKAKRFNPFLTVLTMDIHLVYSPDDEGWYLQKYLRNETHDTVVSQTFNSKERALKAFKEGTVVWK